MRIYLIFLGLFALASCVAPQRPDLPAPTTDRAEVLILGDSQISFGAGQAYRAFFTDLTSACGTMPADFARAQAAAIGVRSTALHHWTTSDPANRRPLCEIDPKFGVNAGSYGVTSPNLSYVQIGADPAYPFCPEGRSALQAVFDTPMFDPDLIVLGFLGNAAQRWQSPARVQADWLNAESQIPPGTACLVMTTIPSFGAQENARRQKAQDHLAAAVNRTGRCVFVAGFTAQTIAEFQDNPRHFRTNAQGEVIDPRHPTAASAARFVELQKPALCAAINRAVTR